MTERIELDKRIIPVFWRSKLMIEKVLYFFFLMDEIRLNRFYCLLHEILRKPDEEFLYEVFKFFLFLQIVFRESSKYSK